MALAACPLATLVALLALTSYAWQHTQRIQVLQHTRALFHAPSLAQTLSLVKCGGCTCHAMLAPPTKTGTSRYGSCSHGCNLFLGSRFLARYPGIARSTGARRRRHGCDRSASTAKAHDRMSSLTRSCTLYGPEEPQASSGDSRVACSHAVSCTACRLHQLMPMHSADAVPPGLARPQTIYPSAACRYWGPRDFFRIGPYRKPLVSHYFPYRPLTDTAPLNNYFISDTLQRNYLFIA